MVSGIENNPIYKARLEKYAQYPIVTKAWEPDGMYRIRFNSYLVTPCRARNVSVLAALAADYVNKLADHIAADNEALLAEFVALVQMYHVQWRDMKAEHAFTRPADGGLSGQTDAPDGIIDIPF